MGKWIAFSRCEILKRGAQPVLRENYKTDNGNLILDCHGLALLDPRAMEAELNNIAGVVTNGIFARRPADVLLLAGENGVRTIRLPAPPYRRAGSAWSSQGAW